MKTKFKLPFNLRCLILPGIALVMLSLGYWFMTDNRAEHAAAPFEQALSQAGAIKRCELGDTGRGPDNSQPYYNAQYTYAAGREKTAEVVKQAAKDSGFELTEQIPEKRPGETYYTDNSKPSPYPDLRQGNIKLGVVVRIDSAYSPKGTCSLAPLASPDPSQTTFTIILALPVFK